MDVNLQTLDTAVLPWGHRNNGMVRLVYTWGWQGKVLAVEVVRREYKFLILLPKYLVLRVVKWVALIRFLFGVWHY